MALRLPRTRRIRRRSEFQHIYDQGLRVRGRFMTLYTSPNATETSRLGVAATRKIGGAVIRNRARRRVRELFRTTSTPAGFDFVVVVRREIVDAEWRELLDEFRVLLRRRGTPGGRRTGA